MSHELTVLLVTAMSLGFLHTLFGPDHYLPFIVLARARRWSFVKTGWITFLCGIGHVLSSVVLGFIGIAVGLAVEKLEWFESTRGEIAAWLMISFGLVYLVWGLRRAWLNKPHTHAHMHADGGKHQHTHTHADEHAHVHDEAKTDWKTLTPWVLFVIFIFGPCEPLIPLLMYPAANENFFSVAIVAGTFSAVTIGTMLSVVLLGSMGLSFAPVKRLERFGHALAGAAILACGLSIQFLGL